MNGVNKMFLLIILMMVSPLFNKTAQTVDNKKTLRRKKCGLYNNLFI